MKKQQKSTEANLNPQPFKNQPVFKHLKFYKNKKTKAASIGRLGLYLSAGYKGNCPKTSTNHLCFKQKSKIFVHWFVRRAIILREDVWPPGRATL